jgi:hypothetical protein
MVQMLDAYRREALRREKEPIEETFAREWESFAEHYGFGHAPNMELLEAFKPWREGRGEFPTDFERPVTWELTSRFKIERQREAQGDAAPLLARHQRLVDEISTLQSKASRRFGRKRRSVPTSRRSTTRSLPLVSVASIRSCSI